MIAAVWWWLWSGFYLVEVGGDSVTLQYHGPPRQQVLPKAEIVGTRWDPGAKLVARPRRSDAIGEGVPQHAAVVESGVRATRDAGSGWWSRRESVILRRRRPSGSPTSLSL